MQCRTNLQQQWELLMGLIECPIIHPQGFVQLYRAIKKEPDLQWLDSHIEDRRQLTVEEQKHRYLNELTGNCDVRLTLCNY